MPPITLLTDFGTADTYVAQVKGAILAIASRAQLVDVTHAVPPQDVFGGAFLLWSAVPAFPGASVHLAVVDPGVGSSRRAIALRCARGDLFVGPDNGLLYPAADRLGGVREAVELTERRYWRPSTSMTFHGRDIFGPVAAHLSLGLPLEALGPPVLDLVHLQLPESNGLHGEILHVDVYGNLVSNISAEQVPTAYVVRIGSRVVRPAPTYAAVARGELLALVGSSGLLEISARDGSAAGLLGAARGTRISVEPR